MKQISQSAKDSRLSLQSGVDFLKDAEQCYHNTKIMTSVRYLPKISQYRY